MKRRRLDGARIKRFFRSFDLRLVTAGTRLRVGGRKREEKNERTDSYKKGLEKTNTETWNLALHGSPIVPACWNGRADWTEGILCSRGFEHKSNSCHGWQIGGRQLRGRLARKLG